MTAVTASAPGKVIVSGEYAVLDGAPAICMAVNRRARVSIAMADESCHTVTAPGYLDEPRNYSSIEESADEIPLLAVIWQSLPTTPEEYLAIELDSRDFLSADGEKLGAGSSAAMTVALAAALDRVAGAGLDIRDTAMQAHRNFQGGAGSGVDIACSFAGNVIGYRMQEPESQTLSWPAGLHYALLWSGRAADTTAQLKKLANTDSMASRASLAESAAAVATAWRDAEPTGILEALRSYTGSLQRFDVDHRLGIFDAGHAELADEAASSGVVYKPCGAGAGDLGIAVSGSESALAEFVAVAKSRSFEALDLVIDVLGVDVEGSIS